MAIKLLNSHSTKIHFLKICSLATTLYPTLSHNDILKQAVSGDYSDTGGHGILLLGLGGRWVYLELHMHGFTVICQECLGPLFCFFISSSNVLSATGGNCSVFVSNHSLIIDMLPTTHIFISYSIPMTMAFLTK